MPETRAISAARLRTTIRRVRLEKACRPAKRQTPRIARLIRPLEGGAAPAANSLGSMSVPTVMSIVDPIHRLAVPALGKRQLTPPWRNDLFPFNALRKGG